MCACGRFGLDTTIPAIGDSGGDGLAGCVAETDVAFCTRLGKGCDPVTALDNCGTMRTTDCGTCSAPTGACIANTCTIPQCADGAGAYKFPATGTVVASLHVNNIQEALLGISADAKSILFLRGAPCVTTAQTLYIGDDPTGQLNYTLKDLTNVATLSTFAQIEEQMTLTGDGLTIIGTSTTGVLQSSTRSASGQTNFSAPTSVPFAAVNAALPAGGKLEWPFLSRDGKVLTFNVSNATMVSQNGVYQAVRASTAAAFPAATMLTGDASLYGGLSGISDDRMTAFGATGSFGTVVLSRSSLTQPFVTNASATSPGAAWRVIPTSSCAFVIGTCEPGGCIREDICTWAKQ
jgi:hypothetical protein